MDILSHGLWASGALKGAQEKTKKKFNFKAAFFFGIFPDLFAFTLPFIYLLLNLVSSSLSISEITHSHSTEGTTRDSLFLNELTGTLYNISHSLVIFLIVFFAVRFIFKKFHYELLGWGLHILMDIPTHTLEFYPTPFLWPLSDYRFDGISWGTPQFLIVNYTILIILYLYLYRRENKKQISTK